MQKVYHSELSFTVTGDNAEQIAKRMQDFMSLIKSEGITDIAITDTTQIDGDGIEDESGLTIDEIINSWW